ncbi:MAG: DUF4299 domain-containing protein [Firmicutes bacterium]|jgi:hypothetical protein|nr:DUF4299 domain-containing protein [Bacillota bacterium]
MSIDIVIRQKGLIKKTMPLEVILGSKLEYGVYDDGLRLEKGKLGETEFAAYSPSSLGRGFSVIWNPKEKEEIVLRALNPTSEGELREFYSSIERMTDYWKCTLEVDGNICDPEEFMQGLDDMVQFNFRVLREMVSKVASGEEKMLTLFSAMWPLTVGKEEAERFLKDIKSFDLWLNEKQSIDAYYAKPNFYRTEDGIIGVYVLTEETLSIFPLQPSVPFGIKDPNTGKALQCDSYRVSLYSITDDKIIGQMDYDKFIENIDSSKFSKFDGDKIIIDGVNLNEMKHMLG